MADIEKEGTATYHNEQSISPSTDSFDVVDERAIGGEDISAMPARYYRSPQIIGSVLVSISRALDGSSKYLSSSNFRLLRWELYPAWQVS